MSNAHFNAGVRTSPPAPLARSKGQRSRSVGKWLARGLLALGFLLSFYCSMFPQGRAAVRALTILPGILSASQPGWQQPVAQPVTHTQKTFSAANGTVFLDIYAPASAAPPVPGSRAGMLVITGVGDNRKEPQVINFSQTFARAGIVVMDVTTPGLLADRVDANDRDAVVQAFRMLQRWPSVGANRVGMFGISAGSALICLGAADARIRAQVA